MPRKPRKWYLMQRGIKLPGLTEEAPEEPPLPKPLPTELASEETPPEAVEPWWHITEVLRFRCPLCGMLPEAFRLENSPYEAEVKLQRFGGRLKGGRGFMVYEAAPEERAAPIRERLYQKLAELCRRLKGES